MFSHRSTVMDLLVIQLKAAIRRVLETKGVRARVLDKVNRYGEVVIGVILERPVPEARALAADALGTTEETSAREGAAAKLEERAHEGEDIAT